MVGLMLESAQPLLRKWEECIEGQGDIRAEIQVDEDLRDFSADVISRACFGSSYSKGKEIFSKLRSLQEIMSHQPFLFGSFSSFGYVSCYYDANIIYDTTKFLMCILQQCNAEG